MGDNQVSHHNKKGELMIPVYYFDTMPDVLPEDDACYIISKYIYLKKRTGLIDSMVRVDSINMAEELPEYAKMKLPKIKAKTFGKVVGLFKMVFGKYHSESGVIMNLLSHPDKPELKKIDYTIPHQRVSAAHCKYAIVTDPSYLNCGTIHCHSDFGAFHSGTDENDERYFDGLHITVGHIDLDYVSIAACIVINGKRVKVDPRQYIEGITQNIELSTPTTQHFRLDNQETIVHAEKDMKYITQMYPTAGGGISDYPTRQIQTEFDWKDWKSWGNDQPEGVKTSCDECVFKEIKVETMLEDIEFVDDDDDRRLFDDDYDQDRFDDRADGTGEFNREDKERFERRFAEPLFKTGEVDENGIKRHDNHISLKDYEIEKGKKLSYSIKCECGTTFFIVDPAKPSPCPNCETLFEARTYTITDYLADRRVSEVDAR
jgi:hypothetical protein